MSKTLENAKTDSDFVKIGKRSKNLISQRQNGSHWQGQTSEGRITLTDHNRELAPWLRTKIVREMIAIGLTITAIAAGLWYFYA